MVRCFAPILIQAKSDTIKSQRMLFPRMSRPELRKSLWMGILKLDHSKAKAYGKYGNHMTIQVESETWLRNDGRRGLHSRDYHTFELIVSEHGSKLNRTEVVEMHSQ